MKTIGRTIYLGLIIIITFAYCKPKEDDDPLLDIPYNPTSYQIIVPPRFPILEIPADNPTTVEGINLGRLLFYDPILSIDSSMSCSSCHLPEFSFTDGKAKSLGVDGLLGKRSSMSLLDIAFSYKGLFWDGRAKNMEEQALMPVIDPVELHETWPNVVEKFKKHNDYPVLFRKAFGIKSKDEITEKLATKAIAQFERLIISSGNSKYDRFLRGEVLLDDDELDGFDMFFNNTFNLPDAQCGHCHNAPLFTTNDYFNNGLTAAATLNDFVDKGRGVVTGIALDNGKFRVPTLRNIALTAPYMHNGSILTLEDVVDHYSRGGHPSINKDPLITQVVLTSRQKQQLIKFLHTLTDTAAIRNPAIQNPF